MIAGRLKRCQQRDSRARGREEPAPVAARSPPGRVDVTSPSGGLKWEQTL